MKFSEYSYVVIYKAVFKLCLVYSIAISNGGLVLRHLLILGSDPVYNAYWCHISIQWLSTYMIAAMKSLIAILEHIDTHKFLLLIYYIKVCFSSYTCAFGIAALSACSITTRYQWLPLTKVMHYNVFN